MNQPITATSHDVIDAAARLRGIVRNTPLVHSDALDERVGSRVHLKLENMQHTGAFKFRGAYNCLSQLDLQRYPDGVVAYSTGNHGQAIATVGRMLSVPTIVVMPTDAPTNKIDKARKQGATIILYDRQSQSREEVATELAKKGRFCIVPPGDNALVIAGQGTVAYEILQELGSDAVDIILTPCGGGGLAAGSCLAVEAAHSAAQIWAAEPADFDDTLRSLHSGVRETNSRQAHSLCDALLAPTPAELPFSINRQRLSGVLVATDEQVLAAMRFLFEEFRVVVEPGGAVAFASLLFNAPAAFSGKSIAVIISGGNVDPALLSRAII